MIGERSSSTGAGVSRIGGGNGGHAAEVGDGGDRRTPVEERRTLAGPETGGPRISRLDFSSGVEGLVVTGGGLGGAGGNDSGRDVGGDGNDRSETTLRDPARGKDHVIAEEVPREAPVERAEFVSPVGSSRHDPISKSDLAEFVGEDVLARLM